jgi:hypothetical protein
MTTPEMTPETRIALDNFANLSKMITANLSRGADLAERRRHATVQLMRAGVSAATMAEAAEISTQAVYKIRDAAKPLLETDPEPVPEAGYKLDTSVAGNEGWEEVTSDADGVDESE